MRHIILSKPRLQAEKNIRGSSFSTGGKAMAPQKRTPPDDLHAEEVEGPRPDFDRALPEARPVRAMAVSSAQGTLLVVPFNISADGAAQLGPPVFHPRCRGLEPRALARATRAVLARGAEWAVTVVKPGAALAGHLEAARWRPGPRLLEMARAAPAAAPEAPGEYIVYGQDRRMLFARLFYRTLEGSLDACEVPVCRDANRLMLSFEERGAFTPEDFAVLCAGGEPAGLVLVGGAADTAEVLYFGVAPEFRGRGMGTALVRRALARATARGMGRIRAFVDERNAPARGIYERLGFSEKRAVDVYVAAAKNFLKRSRR